MERTAHPWYQRRKGAGGRFTIGLLTALSITLAALEWGGAKRVQAEPPHELPVEDPWDGPRVVVIEKKKESAAPRKKRAATSSVVEPGEPDEPAEPTPDPAPDDGPTSDDGPELTPLDSLRGEDDGATAGPFPWELVGVRPYFRDCLKRHPKTLDECTEQRIQDHLARRFQVPEGLRGEVRTMVFFEIDTEGRVTKLVCAPRVDREIEQEVERVLTALPIFVPGSQGGIPVPVRYTIPLRVARR